MMSLGRSFLALLYFVSCGCTNSVPSDPFFDPFERPDPEYQPLKGYLPVSSERGVHKCDPCARKYLFILAAGRSGSTTLFSMLSSLTFFSILWEFHPELFVFGTMLKEAGEVEKKLLMTPGDKHGAKDGVLTSVDFACWAQDWFDHHGYRPAGRGGLEEWDLNANSTVVRGFKMIRVKSDEQMTYLKSLFPCARFIYSYRENVSEYSLFKNEQSKTFLENEKLWLTKWAEIQNPWRSQTHRFPLESFRDLKNWDGLLEWLGLPDCHTNFVLHDHASHGTGNDKRSDPIQCEGESKNGIVGDWSTDHWLDVDKGNEPMAVTPFQDTSLPEPTYKELKEVLPAKLEYDHPMCDPCEKKYLFILAGSNSESGTIKSMLNLLPNFDILLKRHPMVYVFGSMMRIVAREQSRIPEQPEGGKFKTLTVQHEGRITSVDFACWTQDWFDRHVSTDSFMRSEAKGSERPWSAKNTVRGFELQAASHDDRMAELKSLFPCARFIYTYRENVDEAPASEDQRDSSFYHDEVLWMKKWSGTQNDWRDQTWQFPVEKYEDVAYWNEFLQWLGLPNCHVTFVPGVSSHKDGTGPIQCDGHGT